MTLCTGANPVVATSVQNLQTPEGEALRHDDEFLYVGAWEWTGENQPPILHKEPLVYNDIELKQRSYK